MDLFDAGLRDRQTADQPLAARLRPNTLDEFVGQDHILGPGRLLRRAIEADQLSSLIFYGPPGTGKTTLAAVIAHTTRAHFISINAVLAGVADIRRAVDEAGQLHKLHSRNAFVACAHPEWAHGTQFLICTQCQVIAEIARPSVSAASNSGSLSSCMSFE